MSLRQIASELESAGVPAQHGWRWRHTAVQRVLASA
jgi:hypothetical protein